ncbi:MAG: RdgB/HAM1 family non-canonical purine NTP pyrophosphatase [Gammaproteobacteria bacterium]|nr:RdgB/HAM1 family non-canonical purine NTP pyrophosphatase [Gammaproteobacteria bacterium]
MQVVLATANPGKQREFQALLAPLGYQVLLQSLLGVAAPEETGATFEANALLKARHAARCTGLPALADDSGLEVEALGGRPGVRSARYAGEGAGDAANNARLLAELSGVPAAQRGARYRCALAWVSSADDPAALCVQAAWEGHIGEAARGSGGFGYDPLFIPSGCTCTAAELASEEKNRLSHRGQALRALVQRLGAAAGGAGRRA